MIILFVSILLLTELMAIILKVTGMDIEKARFQIISIITHTGFTTKESELIVKHSTRRKLANYLMLISYIGQASLFSLFYTIVNKQRGFLNIFIIILSMAIIILLITKNKRLFLKLELIIEKYLSKKIANKVRRKTLEEILHLDEDYEVTEFVVKLDSKLCNICLKDLKGESIKILLIDKGDKLISFPKGTDIMEQCDKVVIYGKKNELKELNRE